MWGLAVRPQVSFIVSQWAAAPGARVASVAWPVGDAIAITAASFDAVCATLPLRSVGFEAQADAEGRRFIWLDRDTVNKLENLRGPSDSYSDVILRLVKMGEGA